VAGHRRRVASVTLGAAVAVGAVLGLAAPAQAHDVLIGSSPSVGDALTALPETFSVTMNTAVVPATGTEANFGIQITDAAGRFYGDGCLTYVDETMSTPAELGEAGQYEMVWQLVSSDGHTVSSADQPAPLAFTWAPPADFVASTGSATAPVCGEDTAETPEPEMTTQATEPAEPSSEAPADASADGDADTSTLLWIGGAAVAVLLAVGGTLLLVRPKKK